MRYLYGDSSPFPLNENFLETLCAATDACVALFQADLAVEHAREVTEESERAVVAEVARVERLTRDLERALSHHAPALGEQPDTATEAATLKIAELAKGALEDTRLSIQKWRERTVAKAINAIPAVDDIVGAFLVKHQLPGTSWSYEWKAELRGSPGRASVVSATDAGLNATFDAELPSGHLWAQPVKGSLVAPHVSIPLMKKGWFGKERMGKERLDKLFVTHVRHDAESTSITLSQSKREPSPGIELLVRSSLTPGISVLRVDPGGRAIGERATLTGDAADAVRQLWERVEATISDLVCFRKRLVSAAFSETSVERVEQPAVIADALLESLAPIVAEMLRHSRAKGELALKRDLGDGRREEMFISHEEVTKRWARLPLEYQARFDVFDLDEGHTNVMSRSSLGSVSSAPPPALLGAA